MILRRLSSMFMAILCNYKYNYDTAKTTTNKSMGFDLSTIQSCLNLIITTKSKTILMGFDPIEIILVVNIYHCFNVHPVIVTSPLMRYTQHFLLYSDSYHKSKCQHPLNSSDILLFVFLCWIYGRGWTKRKLSVIRLNEYNKLGS